MRQPNIEIRQLDRNTRCHFCADMINALAEEVLVVDRVGSSERVIACGVCLGKVEALIAPKAKEPEIQPAPKAKAKRQKGAK